MVDAKAQAIAVQQGDATLGIVTARALLLGVKGVPTADAGEHPLVRLAEVS